MTMVGQQDPQYTQYMLNTQVINPALVGSRGVSTIGVLYRSQWLGLDGVRGGGGEDFCRGSFCNF